MAKNEKRPLIKQPELHLIPVGLGNAPMSLWLPKQVRHIAQQLPIYIAENAKTARAFLGEVNTTRPIQDIIIYNLDKRGNSEAEITQWLTDPAAKNGIGLVSEAGCPAIADPGAQVVAIAHKLNIPVIPHVGPSSLLLGLMASGLNGQHFTFHGYLPIEANQRRQALRWLEQESAKKHSTQLFIETPYRNQNLFETLCRTLKNDTQLCIACNLTTDNQWVKTKTIAQWQETALPNIERRPTLFLMLAQPKRTHANRSRKTAPSAFKKNVR